MVPSASEKSTQGANDLTRRRKKPRSFLRLETLAAFFIDLPIIEEVYQQSDDALATAALHTCHFWESRSQVAKIHLDSDHRRREHWLLPRETLSDSSPDAQMLGGSLTCKTETCPSDSWQRRLSLSPCWARPRAQWHNKKECCIASATARMDQNLLATWSSMPPAMSMPRPGTVAPMAWARWL